MLAVVFVPAMSCGPIPLPAAEVRSKPAESAAIVANPHMGWETFHRPADKDPALPDWIPSTVYYLRWGWRDVEPQEGRLNTRLIDGALADARRAGQTLAFRIMCCSSTPSEPYHPDWLPQDGVRRTRYDRTELTVPDLDHPVVLERHLSLIKRLAQRYDGHPDLDLVDLGAVGWWGEWHMSGGGPVGMPRAENCRKIVDAYLAGFKKTPLVMLIGGGQQLAYACSRGAGWRADCLGDMGGFSATWCHMRKGYPQWFREAGLASVWKRAPVAYETCWDMRKWVAEKWPLRYIFNYALATHASVVNNKSAPLPSVAEVRPELERFLKRLGYRFVLREVRHPALVRAGARLSIRSVWQNAGSAPCYRPYRVCWRLRSRGRTVLLPSAHTVKKWMPGEVEVFTEEFLKSPPDLPNGPLNPCKDELVLPLDIEPGEYGLDVAIVDPSGKRPILRLAIEGRREDGWYAVSKLRVSR